MKGLDFEMEKKISCMLPILVVWFSKALGIGWSVPPQEYMYIMKYISIIWKMDKKIKGVTFQWHFFLV